MSQGYNVAVVGATGAVGVEMMETLAKRNFPVKNLRLFASERSVGKKLKFKGTDIGVELLKADVFKGVDFALFNANASRSKEFAPAASRAGGHRQFLGLPHGRTYRWSCRG
jgi:aspartate-semialdehyde dehydrogenase